jgi:hypothetical protein
MPESHLRAADADRVAVATALGEHMSAGRLTLAEYDERVAHAYAARTFGELTELTADLPALGTQPVAAPAPAYRPEPPSACGPVGGGRNDHAWQAWLRTALIVTTIWLITSLSSGGLTYFWPMWVVGPWGAVLLAQRFGGGRTRPGTDRRA